MIYQIGNTATLALNPPVTDPNVYSYVWRFWDGSIEVTTASTIQKRINIGGQPDSAERLLYTCLPTLIDGQSGSVFGTLYAYNAPFVKDVLISNNDDYYGYSTVLSLIGYSLMGRTLQFEWFDVPAVGPPVSLGIIAATPTAPFVHVWRGNDTSTNVAVTGYHDQITISPVRVDKLIRCVITDTAAATTTVDYRLRGKAVPPIGVLLSADANSVTTDATSQPIQRIGEGQFVTFVAYAHDIDNKKPAFYWDFAGTRGWTTPFYGNGTGNPQLPDGSWSNSFTKDVSTEIVSAGTSKTASVICRIVGTDITSRSLGQITNVQFDVALLKNNAPSVPTIMCHKPDGTVVNMLTDVVPVGTVLIYSAISTDPDLDIVEQVWQFDSLPSPYPTVKYFAYGPKVTLDTTGFGIGYKPQGSIISTDRLGATAPATSFIGPEIGP
jgi:hypothetical protein